MGVGLQDLAAVTWTRRSSSAVGIETLSHCPHRLLTIAQWFVHLAKEAVLPSREREIGHWGCYADIDADIELGHSIGLTDSQPVLSDSRVLSCRINLDKVIPDSRLDLFSIQVGDYQVGVLQRHVAIDAVLANLRTQLHKFAAVLILMTPQTFFRIRRCDMFRRMHLMARCTRHL